MLRQREEKREERLVGVTAEVLGQEGAAAAAAENAGADGYLLMQTEEEASFVSLI